MKKESIFENDTDLISRLPGGAGIMHEENGCFYLDFANDEWLSSHYGSIDSGKKLIGGNVLEYMYEQDREAIAAEYRRVRGSHELQGEGTYRLHGADGTLHWFHVLFRYACTQEQTEYYYAISNELDKQKKTEERLEESRSALRDAVANSDIQFFTYFPGERYCEIYAVNDRVGELPTVWKNYPDDFVAYAKCSAHDAEAYRQMVGRIDDGADKAECTIQLAYKGVYTWERLVMRSVRDENGRVVKGQGYSINVTERRKAEERLQEERVRHKSLEADTFEAFSFNISKVSQPNIKTSDTAMMEGTVSDTILEEALRICPALSHTNPATREILLRAAARIPDSKDRELFISTCSGDAVRNAVKEGRYSAEIRYRRYVGNCIRWVRTTMEVLPDPNNGDLLAFYYTSDINRNVLYEKITRQIIKHGYEEVVFCDLQTKQLYVKAVGDSDRLDYTEKPYGDALDYLTDKLSSSRDADEFRRKFALKTIVEKLCSEPVYTVFFTEKDENPLYHGQEQRQMKCDVLYLDEHCDVLIYLLVDVTEVYEQDRENRERMEAALTAAKQASSAKSDFLSRMSHEIRTPLNAIIGMDTIAAQSINDPERIGDCVSKIGISARFLLSLINDILDMSRIESGKMLLKNEKFLFRDFISGINTMVYNQTRQKGLDYECTVSSEIAEAYIGDSMKLQQILVNILGNAVKFTKSGKVTIDIHPLSGKNNQSVVRFAVNDTGIGIRDEALERIFEPFEQGDNSATSAFGGTGLGLAITKNLVELMGGSIRVRSIVGVGSEFTADIPLAIDESVLVQPRLDMHFEKMKTLIVDDDLVVCEQTNNILTEIGMSGELVTTGAEAVEKVLVNYGRSSFYDFILIDWKMPDMDGLETTRQIRRIVGPDVTIIIITAYDWESIEVEARSAGANMFISKPLMKSTLVSAFEKSMGDGGECSTGTDEVFDFTGRRVLVAEDNQINAEIAKNLLELKHFKVEQAVNGLKAMEMFVQHPVGYYDAILMDIRMPLMDGLQATVNIRHWNRADAKKIPIIAMTANAFDEDVEKSRAAGMNAHLSKPIEPNTMYATLERVMNEEQ